MKNICLLLLFVIAIALNGCSVGERQISVENCGEPIAISDCKWKGQLYTCLIKNTSNEIYPGVNIWKFDQNDQPLEQAPYTYGTGLKPGELRREKLPVTKYGKDPTVKVIFCRNRPAVKAAQSIPDAAPGRN